MYFCLRLTVCLHMSTYPIFSSLMMPSDAYPRFFSPILAYPASWHVSVPIVLLFFNSLLLLRFYPTGACPCLTGFSAVQHVSVLRNDFSHTFPNVVSFSLTPFSYKPLLPSKFLLSLCFSYFYVFVPVSRLLSCTLTRRSCYDFWSRCAH